MATSTPNIGLVLPSRSEFFNIWDVPVNENFTKIDTSLGGALAEIVAARGSSTNLQTRLAVALNNDGTLKDVPEVAEARSSKIYGSDDGTSDYTLDGRIENADFEIFTARQQLAGLRDAAAWAENDNTPNALISGPTNPITFSGAVATVNGAVTPVVGNINGYRQVVRTNKTQTISGSAGTYYLYLDRASAGETIYTIPSASGTTAIFTPTAKLSRFTSAGGNFVTAGVKPGDILKITAPGANLNLGNWIVHSTNAEDPTNLAPNEVRIIGEFRSAVSGLSAEVINPIAPSFGFTSTPPSPLFSQYSNRIYIGRAVFDGSNITSVVQYAYKGRYAEWHSVTPIGGDFSLTIPHNLGYIPKAIHLYASQANNFTQPLEPLSVGKMTAGAASVTAGDQTLTYTPPVLRRSVVVRFTDTTIEIKNATNGVYYEDYGGSVQTTGFMYVVIER